MASRCSFCAWLERGEGHFVREESDLLALDPLLPLAGEVSHTVVLAEGRNGNRQEDGNEYHP